MRDGYGYSVLTSNRGDDGLYALVDKIRVDSMVKAETIMKGVGENQRIEIRSPTERLLDSRTGPVPALAAVS